MEKKAWREKTGVEATDVRRTEGVGTGMPGAPIKPLRAEEELRDGNYSFKEIETLHR